MANQSQDNSSSIDSSLDAASKSSRSRKLRTTDLALIGMIAGVYSVLTVFGGALSFGSINLRFSNALIGLVPIFGWPAVFGVALGVFFGNMLGPNLVLSTSSSRPSSVCLVL